jgi:hypothetical protein
LRPLASAPVTGGLMGVLRMPSARSMAVDNPPAKPVPTDPQTQCPNGYAPLNSSGSASRALAMAT